MIYSKNRSSEDTGELCSASQGQYAYALIVVVSTTYDHIYESGLYDWGVNITIYVSHMPHAAYSAMMSVAKIMLENERALEAYELCVPIEEISGLIPGTK